MQMRILMSIILLSSILMLAWCNKKAPTDGNGTPTTKKQQDKQAPVVNEGDTIGVEYVGTLEDGEVFDTNIAAIAQEADIYNEQRPYELLNFTVGAGQMIPGFDKGVVGMQLGDTKKIDVAPEDGYGNIREELVQELAIEDFQEAGITPTVGETYNFGIAQGKVLEITDSIVKMDFNHFLAGKKLSFEVTVKEIIPAEANDSDEADPVGASNANETDPVQVSDTDETDPTETSSQYRRLNAGGGQYWRLNSSVIKTYQRLAGGGQYWRLNDV